MTSDNLTPCRACGQPCDGDVCDQTCQAHAEAKAWQAAVPDLHECEECAGAYNHALGPWQVTAADWPELDDGAEPDAVGIVRYYVRHHPPDIRMANATLIAAAPDLLAALQKAAHELNEIRARDGVPYTSYGWKSSVDEKYFSVVVDECFAAIEKATGMQA